MNRLVTTSLLLSLALYGCGKDEPASISALDAARTAPAGTATTDASSGSAPAGAASASDAAGAGTSAAPAPGAAANASGADAGASAPSASAPPSSASSPRVSAPPAAAAQRNDAKAAPSPARSARAASGDYTIVKGDTLASIARAHDLDPGDLAKWNDIEDPRRLQIGRKLRLSPPGG